MLRGGQREVSARGIQQVAPRCDMRETDRDDPLTWLLLLERGRRTGDFELAARAKRELERLGIRVTYGHRPRRLSQTKESPRAS